MGVRLIKYGVNSDAGTYNHDELRHRDYEDQHPIKAITGLTEILSNMNQINSTVDSKTISLSYNETDKSLTGNVKVSAQAKNSLTVNEDGLFVKESASSLIEVNQTAHGFSDLQLSYINSSGVYTLASSKTKQASEALGIVKVTDADNFELVTSGLYKTAAITFQKGSIVFLSGNGTLVTEFTDDMKVIKMIGTVVNEGILIDIQEGFSRDDFDISLFTPTIYSNKLDINKIYPYLTMVDFNIDIPYNECILKGFVIEMEFSHSTNSRQDVFHFSVRESIYEPNGSSNLISETSWTGHEYIGFSTASDNTVSTIYAGQFNGDGQTSFDTSVNGVSYKDLDGTSQIHLRIWCYGQASYTTNTNNIISITPYVQNIEK